MRPHRYPSDTSDEEWSLIEPLLPVPACQTRTGGRPEKHHRRDIFDAIRYVTDNACKWRALPADFPPYQTVFGFFSRWTRAGVFNRVRDELRRAIRLRAGRCPNPVAGIIDSQSVRAAATVTGRSRSYDAGKRVAGRKRHLVVDTFGLLMMVMVTAAGQPDRDAARELLARLRMLHPQLTLIWGDSAYTGTLVEWARRFLHLTLKIVTKRPGQTGFKVLARRWIVERSLSWLMNARRNVVDFERKPSHSEAHLTVAAITLMTRRLTRKRPPAWTRRPASVPQAA
ncbi:IS5 family transposase [Spongiactinospora rosea]|uniref:IS5 family transposase n=1 Tax=Spongiactinospora rosea TaxID=2248750 RepID=A0A366LCL7_9ACTN|nr:IS5 family transposase [Spongiactinospora rosea]RBQ11647.1 IS5 family transposase [Spongiactinospora rosea]